MYVDRLIKFATRSPEKLVGSEWAVILVSCPELINIADLDLFTGNDWAYVLNNRPEFIKRADFSKLVGINWADPLYAAQPTLPRRYF